MSTIKKLMMTAAGGDFTAIEDVFSTYLYTGTSSTQTITNGIDLAGEGGMVWIKNRSSIRHHTLFDTERGAEYVLKPSESIAQAFLINSITSFNSNGFSLGSNVETNVSADKYASWTFRKAPRWFDVVTYTGNGIAGKTISHNLGVTPGAILIKCISDAENWRMWNRTFPADTSIMLNSTGVTTTTVNFLNNTLPTDTTITLGNHKDCNTLNDTYVAYLFAHDPLGPSGDGSDGLIACGSFTTDGSGNATVDLGWEPQFIIWKRSDGVGYWRMQDNMRGFGVDKSQNPRLYPNYSSAEAASSDIYSRSTGFGVSAVDSSSQFIYIAIRRGPMREPASGTEVFNADYYGGTTSSAMGYLGAPSDAQIFGYLAGSAANAAVESRLTGKGVLTTSSNTDEGTRGDNYWDNMIGYAKSGTTYSLNTNFITYNFRRAPGFFDVVAYTGTGVARTVPHNLGVAPELVIFKARNLTSSWFVTTGYTASTYDSGILNTTDPLYTNGYNPSVVTAAPTNKVLNIGGTSLLNGNTYTYVAYLFATRSGVSKVGSYTGNGSSQTINCGFTSGARFVLIKRTDSTGDWYVWDTERGIVAGNDPHLSLNSSAAQVTSDDTIDPASSGFIVNQVAATNVNVSSASYIYLAIA